MEKNERKKLFWQTYLIGAALAAAVLGAVAAFGGRGTAAFALGGRRGPCGGAGGARLPVSRLGRGAERIGRGVLVPSAVGHRVWRRGAGIVCAVCRRAGRAGAAAVLPAGAGRAPGAGEKKSRKRKGKAVC